MIRKSLTILVLFVVIEIPMIAQPGDPGGGVDPDIPVTGGILYLVAAGLGYGFYAIKKKMKDR